MSTSPSPSEKKAALYQQQAQIASETEARLAADPAVQEWLKQFAFDGAGVLQRYGENKASYLTNGPGWLEQEQFMAAWPRKQAYERLWEIQQKKLFNLQCAWWAGQLTLPEVTDGQEFAAWGKAIWTCPVLEPITEEELALYLDYLASDYCHDLAANRLPPTNWQDYENFRHWMLLEEAGSGSPGHDMVREGLPADLGDALGGLFNLFYQYPDWYGYYDLYRGTGYLLRLPPVRLPPDPPTEALPEAEPAEVPAAEAPAADAPALRHLSAYDLPLTETLLKRFEAPELVRYMRVMEHQPEQDDLTADADATYQLLSDIPQPIPIAAGDDWRQCLLAAYLAYQRRVVSEGLRTEYADYLAREQAGQPHPAP